MLLYSDHTSSPPDQAPGTGGGTEVKPELDNTSGCSSEHSSAAAQCAGRVLGNYDDTRLTADTPHTTNTPLADILCYVEKNLTES